MCRSPESDGPILIFAPELLAPDPRRLANRAIQLALRHFRNRRVLLNRDALGRRQLLKVVVARFEPMGESEKLLVLVEGQRVKRRLHVVEV
jgi:hypothetical protein